MRYYNIIISNPETQAVIRQYSSLTAQGDYSPSCLRVQMDIPANNFSAPAGAAMVKIYGVSFADINQTTDLNGATITVYGGMSEGLPLANAQQNGMISTGTIFQGFGNWQGNEITLDLIFYGLTGTVNKPVNLNLTWRKGTKMQTMIEQALQQAYPLSKKATGTISSSLTAPQDIPFSYSDLPTFANRVFDVSRTIIPSSTYKGVQIAPVAGGFYLYDGTAQRDAKQINFTDLIGNGTWSAPGLINFKTVMRADLAVGDIVRMPQGVNLLNVPNSFTQFRNKSSFQNTFQIYSLRHVGDSRQPNADSWCTVIEASDLGPGITS